MIDCITPDWPAPPNVRALITTRKGGVSHKPYDSLNLGAHVGDVEAAVQENRARLRELLPAEPVWLNQVHGNHVIVASQTTAAANADASVSHESGVVCAVLTADCLPVLLCDIRGSVVGIAHAGWRGLAAGVIEATVAAMQVGPVSLLAYLGPAIGARAFETGAEVREVFVAHDSQAEAAFVPKPALKPGAADKWLADLYLLARQRLNACGVTQVFGGGYCTYHEPQRFFSYRRDQATGRMASLIWLENRLEK